MANQSLNRLPVQRAIRSGTSATQGILAAMLHSLVLMFYLNLSLSYSRALSLGQCVSFPAPSGIQDCKASCLGTSSSAFSSAEFHHCCAAGSPPRYLRSLQH